SEDMSRVYLTLNQGCTNLKKEVGTKAAKESMISTREMIRNTLNNNRFNTDNDLIIENVDYEIGSIYYKEYLRDDFPNEKGFLEDLKDMIRIYNDYYNLIYLKDNEIIDNQIEIKLNTQKSEEKNMKDNINRIY